MSALSDDPDLVDGRESAMVAAEAFVAGFIAQAQGQNNRANNFYRKAFALSAKVPNLRSASIASHVFALISDDSCLRSLVLKQTSAIHRLATRFSATLPVADNEFVPLSKHPVFLSLSAVQQEVVVMLCQGMKSEEIARRRNVAHSTIRNMLTKYIYPAFGVPNRAALISVCLGGEGSTGPKQRRGTRRVQAGDSRRVQTTLPKLSKRRSTTSRSGSAVRGSKKTDPVRRTLKVK